MGGWTGAGAVGALAVFAVCVCRDWPQQSIVGWLRQVSTDGCSNHVDILVVSPSGASPTVHRVTAAVRAAEAQLSGFPTYRLHVHRGTLTGPSDTKIQPSPLPAIKDIASIGPDAALPVPSEEGMPDQPGTCSGIAVVRALAQLYSTSTSVPDGVVSVPWPGWVRTSDHGIVLFLCDRMSPTEGLAAVVATELDPEEAPPPDRFDTAVVLVDGADRTTTATLGDPTCADVYQDGSHLNTEQTLRCLLDQPRGRDSAQAAFLRRGLDVRVHDMEGSLSGERLDRIFLHTILDTRHDHCTDRPVSDIEAALTPWLTCPTPTMEAVPRLMSDTNSSVADAVAGGKPTLLVGTVVDDWSFFAKHSSVSTVVRAVAATDENVNGHGGVFVDVKLSPRGNFMDPSTDAKLADALPPIDLGYTTANMTAPELIQALNIQQAPHVLGRAWGDMGHTVSQHFVALPRAMHDLFEPSQPLFWTDEDHRLRKQFLWMSSPGGRTHLHFDQDHNVFVQLVGTKRFTLYPAADHHRLLPFPRLHPLWHKAQVEFPVPGVLDDGRLRCAAGRRQQVIVGPGDVLYIPPYVWHEVETLTPSVSMASLSHDDAIRSAMEMIYRHDFKFDLLVDRSGKVAALRLLLDLAVGMLYSRRPGAATRFVRGLLRERYGAVLRHDADLRRLDLDSVASCQFEGVPPNTVPTAQHVYQDCLADARILTSAFQSIPPEARDVLFADLFEEFIAGVVGGPSVLRFLHGCFGPAPLQYHLTQTGDEAHVQLWRYYDEEIDGELG